MSEQPRLATRGARLVAMALSARNEGHFGFAARLTQRAAEVRNRPTALERLGTQASHLRHRLALIHPKAG
jgi:hypothetical protein